MDNFKAQLNARDSEMVDVYTPTWGSTWEDKKVIVWFSSPIDFFAEVLDEESFDRLANGEVMSFKLEVADEQP